MIDALIAHLPPHSLVLDIGCGTGLQAHELARAGYRVVAVDNDFDAVATGRDLGEPAELPEPAEPAGRPGTPHFLAGRAEDLPFSDALFDAVVCLDVLHWSENAAKFESTWNEAWRVLKGGGLFHVRCLFRDALPSAVPQGDHADDGQFRLDSGTTWFLPNRAQLDSLLAHCGGSWLLPPEANTQGAATMTARKPALR